MPYLPRRGTIGRRPGPLAGAGLCVAVAVLGLAAAAEAAFWLPMDLAGNDPTVTVAIGDSITAGVLGEPPFPLTSQPYPAGLQGLLQAQHPGVAVLNRGQGGETTDGGLARLAGVLAQDRPAVVLIMEGTNDATFDFDSDQVVANLRAMVQRVKAASAVPILGLIVPNFRDDDDAHAIIDAVNAQLPGVAAAEGVRLVDTFSGMNSASFFGPDGLHPTQQGYDVLAALWQPAVHAALGDIQTLLGGVSVAGGHLGGAPGDQHLLAGSGPGKPSAVRAFHPDGTPFGPGFSPYPAPFLGGVRLAACDVDGDGRADVVTGAGPGGGPHVMVWKLDAAGAPIGALASFFAFVPAFTGGVFVACGDLDGDGVPEIVVGAGRGGGPHVRAFRYAPAAPGGVEDFGVSFFAYAAGFRGGVTVAVGNLDGNGPEIITGAGPGGGPHVRAFHYAPAAVGGVTDDAAVNFFAYTPLFTGGVHVAAGNLTGGSRAELITGAGPGGGPHVRVFFDGTVADVPGFFAYVPGFTGGVSVGVAGSEVLTGVGPGGGPHVRRFASDGSPLGGGFFAFPFP